MEYTGNDMQDDTHLTSSLLKMFSMFEIFLSVGDVNVELEVDTDLVMLCHTTTTSTSSTLKNLYIGKDYHSSYSTDHYNDHKESMDILFSTYITPQIKEIYHPAIIQEWKLNIDSAEYEKIMSLTHLPSLFKKKSYLQF